MIYANSVQANSDKDAVSMAQFDETAAATASILPQQQSSTPLVSSHYFSQTEQHSHVVYEQQESTDDLRLVAGEILSGIRRNVEVQIIHPNNPSINTFNGCTIVNSADYLNPVSKDELVQESGLGGKNEIGNDFFVTEIDPIELGINMTTSGEDEVLFGDDFNLNYFGLTSAGGNIVA